jgi:hypothetical protein
MMKRTENVPILIQETKVLINTLSIVKQVFQMHAEYPKNQTLISRK